VIVEQDGAEDGAFGVEVLRERAFESRGGGHFRIVLVIRFLFATTYNTPPCGAQAGLASLDTFRKNFGWLAVRRLRAL
jgi:hypothetical protein